MSRAKYVGVRAAQTVFLLWIILTFLFFFFRLMPGDYTSLMMQGGADPAQVAEFEAKWGLDQPLYIQYLNYMQNFVTGDVGTSLQTQQPVWDMVNHRILNSVVLVAPAITAAYILGPALGTLFGTKRGSFFEKRGLFVTILLGTIPIFFTAILVITIFSERLALFPATGMVDAATARQYDDLSQWRMYFTKDFLLHYTLPFLVIVLRYTYFPTLIMRTSVVEVKDQDFMYFHRMTGLPRRMRYKQIAKHASLPVITVYPISMAQAVGGLVLLEVVFAWPGIGFSLVQGVLQRDLPTVQFVFFIVAAVVIIGNFVVDVLYGYIDPRVSLGDEST